VLLLSTLSSLKVANTVTSVKLNTNLVVKVGLALVKTTSLDDNLSLHNVEASVKARTAVTTEEVVVDLARGSSDVVLLGGSLGDAERVSWDYSVGGKSTPGPFLAVDAVAEGSDIRFAGALVSDSTTHAAAGKSHCIGRFNDKRFKQGS
jgi:hypothetical protein